MWSHSQPLASFCNKLDYLGILVLMWGAGIPTVYYGLFCNQNLQWLYWMTVSLSLDAYRDLLYEADSFFIDVQHRTSMYYSHITPTIHLTPIQALACVLLRWLWVELCDICHSWSGYTWMGYSTGTHVSALDGLDGHV